MQAHTMSDDAEARTPLDLARIALAAQMAAFRGDEAALEMLSGTFDNPEEMAAASGFLVGMLLAMLAEAWGVTREEAAARAAELLAQLPEDGP